VTSTQSSARPRRAMMMTKIRKKTKAAPRIPNSQKGDDNLLGGLLPDPFTVLPEEPLGRYDRLGGFFAGFSGAGG